MKEKNSIKGQLIKENEDLRQRTGQLETPPSNQRVCKQENSCGQCVEKYRGVFEATGDAIFIIDEETRLIVDVNSAACMMYGYDREEMLKLKNSDISVEPEKTNEAVNSRSAKVPLRYHKKKNGVIFPVEITGSYYTQNGRKFHIAAIRDITDRIRSEIKLKESEEKFKGIFSQSPIGILLYDRDGNLNDANDASLKMFGAAGLEVLRNLNLFHCQAFPEKLKDQLLCGLTINFEHKFDFEKVKEKQFFPTTKSGSFFIDCCIKPLGTDTGTRGGFLVQVQDITERKRVEEQLKYLSLHDSLTGLYNRAYFEQEMKRQKGARNNLLSIILCDVDGLKLVNDTMGHDAGDELLVAAAGVIKQNFREGDMVARIGGDEFAILLPGSAREKAASLCGRIRESVNRYNEANPKCPLSISIGFATCDSSVSQEDLFKEADNNMFREKLHSSQSARSAIVQTLMKALEARDFITEGHADRLKHLAVRLANAVGLPEGRITDLRLLAQFHDIGKVGIPDSILFKEGPLTEEQMRIMQQHCEIGYRIARSASDLVPIADLILRHHEWWNGKGYPLKLKGNDIPLECRILAIADAYDAMTSDRPYRKAMSHKDAIDEIVKYSGTQFDPELAKLFIQLPNLEG